MEPENLNLSDGELLADLQRVATRLGQRALTIESYDRHGCVAAGTIRRRFGGWNLALVAAGLVPVKQSRITAGEIVEDLRRVGRELKVGSFSRSQYKIHGRFGGTTVERFFGSWTNALRGAGLRVDRTSGRTTEKELFDNLEMLWQNLGRQPRGSDVCKPQSRFNLKTYKNRFGGIRNALRAFVRFKESRKQSMGSWAGKGFVLNRRTHKTPRNVNIRLRYLILRRDHFRCCACGRSPAIDAGVSLHIDHIVPWSKGGETVEANLQTLCERCNGGKGDL